jgi:hypothetical protein
MSSLKIVVLAVCGTLLALGILVRKPVWILAACGGAVAALLMPLEMPS